MKLDPKVQTSNNLPNFTNRYGNCFGMTLSYIKNSKRYGGITSSWQIDNGVIAQAQLVNQWNSQKETDAISRAGLRVNGVATSDYLELKKINGYYMIIIDNPAHAVGGLIDGNDIQFFDSNSGLHRATDIDDLYNQVWQYLNRTYPGWSLRSIIPITG